MRFGNRPPEEQPLERKDPRDQGLELMDEALLDLDVERPYQAVMHLAHALWVRAKADDDLLALSRAKQLMQATGARGLRS